MVLAGILFLKTGTDQAKHLKIEYLLVFSCGFTKRKFWATCHKLCNSPKCFWGSKCLLMFLVGQHYIKITNLSKIIWFFSAVFEKPHENPHEINLKCLAWSILDRISQKPLVEFFIDTHRDIKTRYCAFLVYFSRFSQKCVLLVYPSAHPSMSSKKFWQQKMSTGST